MSYQDQIKNLHPLSPQERTQKKSLLKTRVNQIDFEKIKNVADLVEAYQGSSIQARNVGQCANIFERMLKDKERPTIMLGLAGPLIAAGLRKVIRDLIHYNMVDVVVSTGAILYQDFYAAMGAGLVPVAVGYIVAHYLTYLLTEGQRIVVALSDPFQQGWDLLGTVHYEPTDDWLSTSAVWTLQVIAVVLGHVVGAWLGHAAVRDRRQRGEQASQWPLAALMISMTVVALWSLGQNLVFVSEAAVAT